MTDIRCKKCNRLLMKIKEAAGVMVQCKCPKCGYLNEESLTDWVKLK